jgi:hypothetical protein
MDYGTIDPQAVHMLAQYRPFEGGSAGMHAAHDDLVVAACQSNGGQFENLEACRQFIEQRLCVELELQEVRDARDRLILDNQVVKRDGGLALTPDARATLDAERIAWEDARDTAFAEWEVALRRWFPGMPDVHIAVLKDQVGPWLDRVVATHGAEASLLLYPSHPKAASLIDAITKIDLGFLPRCDESLEHNRAAAFRLLVRNPTQAQGMYLDRLLNTGFYLTVMTLDPRVKELAQAEASKITLYLDTNFLYSVLGVGSATEAFGARRFIELCKQLGVALRISPWTADELRTSIASNRQDVERFGQSRKVAAVMAQVSGEKGFEAAYWRTASTSGENPASFFGKFAHFQRFLEGYGIYEHPEGVPEVEADIVGIRDHASPLEGMYGPGSRPRVVIEHDAKMRMLIEHLRSQHKPPAGYTDVRYWFVTESTRLPTYARFGIDGAGRPDFPFCILSSTWAQLLRAMVPRTSDLNGMVAALLASPFVGYRSAPRGAAQLTAIERITRSIESLKDVPPAVAIAVINDQAMSTKIGEETDPVVIEQVIEDAMSAKALELEAELETAADRIVDAESTRDRAQAARLTAEQERDRLEAERDRAVADACRNRSELENSMDSHRADSEALRDQVEEVRQRLDDTEAEVRSAREKSRRMRRNAGAISGSVLATGVGAALISTGAVSGVFADLAVIAVVAVAIYGTVRVISKHLAIEVIAIIAIVSAIVTIASLVIASENHQGSKGQNSAGAKTKSPH